MLQHYWVSCWMKEAKQMEKNSGEWKLICIDRKYSSGWMGRVGKGNKERLQKIMGNIFGGIDMFIILITWLISWVCTHMSKPIKLYTLNMCNLLYINYTSIKMVKSKCRLMMRNLNRVTAEPQGLSVVWFPAWDSSCGICNLLSLTLPLLASLSPIVIICKIVVTTFFTLLPISRGPLWKLEVIMHVKVLCKL